ncbi:MAG: hypothetical protein ACYTFY_06350 [Planctomycetota bacterium]|jgi:hypothetical protein
MSFCTKSPNAGQAGTAIVETLLIFIPVWTFFYAGMLMLQYWEANHIDQSVDMENHFARQTITGLVFDKGWMPDTKKNKYKGQFKFYCESVNKAKKSEVALPKYYFYVTDQQSRNMVIYRGTHTWAPFIWLKGQHWGKWEDDIRRAWFEDMGNKTLNDSREALMLGS